IYFKIFILAFNFGFFGLPVRVRIIFVPTYKTCLGILHFR
ncbi:unnamed protein product, partial [Brassica rapa]